MRKILNMQYIIFHLTKNLKKKLYGPFFRMGFNCPKARATSRRQFTFYHSVPKNSQYSFYRPWKDERLSRPWSHLVVLNTGLLDCESSTLITWPLLLLKKHATSNLKRFQYQISTVAKRSKYLSIMTNFQHFFANYLL